MTADLDSVLPPDPNARAVWLTVQRLEWSALCSTVRARGSHRARPAIDPALWMPLRRPPSRRARPATGRPKSGAAHCTSLPLRFPPAQPPETWTQTRPSL